MNKVTRARSLALSMLAVVCVVAAPAGASARDSNDGKLIDKPFEQCLIKHFQTRFFNRIDATPDQRQKLSAIISRRSDETRPLREELRQKALELNGLMAAEGASDEEIISKAKEVQAARNKVMDERVKSVLEARAVLTQDQRQQISDRIAGLITGTWKSRFAGIQ